MPLGKYYCDYCDKEFQDTAFARRRHLQSLHHLRTKALWFDSFKTNTNTHTHTHNNDDYLSAPAKGICNRFVQTGFCQYGDSCRYFHPNQNMPNANAQPQIGLAGTCLQSPTIPGNQSGNLVRDSMGMSWGNLPPSLKPPPEGGYPSLPQLDWG